MFRTGFAQVIGRPRLGGLETIYPSHTSELRAGDLIKVTFPALSTGGLAFGTSEVFVVTGIDPSNGKVGLRDEGGEMYYVDGGSYEDLKAKLSSLSSFDSIEILRPSGGLESVSAGEMDLINGAIALGLPSGYGPSGASVYGDLRDGDHLFSTSQYGGIRRLWRVYDDSDSDWIKIELVGSDGASDVIGEVNAGHRNDVLQSGNEMAFRNGYPMPWEGGNGDIPRSSDGGGSPLVLAGAAAAAMAILFVLLS